jgi:hypothetical protein
MQGQQISVAGEDQVSFAVQSDFEKLVIFGINGRIGQKRGFWQGGWHHQHRPPILAQNARMGHPKFRYVTERRTTLGIVG